MQHWHRCWGPSPCQIVLQKNLGEIRIRLEWYDYVILCDWNFLKFGSGSLILLPLALKWVLYLNGPFVLAVMRIDLDRFKWLETWLQTIVGSNSDSKYMQILILWFGKNNDLIPLHYHPRYHETIVNCGDPPKIVFICCTSRHVLIFNNPGFILNPGLEVPQLMLRSDTYLRDDPQKRATEKTIFQCLCQPLDCWLGRRTAERKQISCHRFYLVPNVASYLYSSVIDIPICYNLLLWESKLKVIEAETPKVIKFDWYNILLCLFEWLL